MWLQVVDFDRLIARFRQFGGWRLVWQYVRMGVLQGQGGWRIAYFADNLQIFCFFLVVSIKKRIFAADI